MTRPVRRVPGLLTTCLDPGSPTIVDPEPTSKAVTLTKFVTIDIFQNATPLGGLNDLSVPTSESNPRRGSIFSLSRILVGDLW